MRKPLGVMALVVGVAVIVGGMAMDTTVLVPGVRPQIIGTTYGTTTIEGTPDRYVHNVGLMQRQQNFLIVGGVLSVIGVLMLLIPAGRPSEPQREATPADATEDALITPDELAKLGIVMQGDEYLCGGMRFNSPEAAALFARSRK
jgi:hypothetical protein